MSDTHAAALRTTADVHLQHIDRVQAAKAAQAEADRVARDRVAAQTTARLTGETT